MEMTVTLYRLRRSLHSRRMKEIFHHLRLHSLNFETIATGGCLEFFGASILVHLQQPALKTLNAFLRCFQFLLGANHAVTSTMPRFEPSRLICQYSMNSSTFSLINMPGRIQKTLAPYRAWATACSKIPRDCAGQFSSRNASFITRMMSTSFGFGLADT